MTFLQSRPKTRPIDKIDVPRSIVETFTAMGHDVDWRAPQLGEDLSGYDLLWLCLAPMNSVNARKAPLGTLWALRQPVPKVAFFDDWQFPQVMNALRSVAKDPTKHLYKFLSFRKDSASQEAYYSEAPAEVIKEHQQLLVDTMNGLLGDLWTQEGIVPVVPMYRWGDRSIVRKRMHAGVQGIIPIDPSPTIMESIVMQVEPLSPAEKQRRWALAALMPHGDWRDGLPNAWPIDTFGSKKLKAERLAGEVDVLEAYNRRWGILSPPYFSAGSGWWRSRFIYAARAGSVLVCGKGEGAPLGSAYSYTVPQVEAMSDETLQVVANAQRDALRPWLTTMDDWRRDLMSIADEASRRRLMKG